MLYTPLPPTNFSDARKVKSGVGIETVIFDENGNPIESNVVSLQDYLRDRKQD